MDDVSVRELSNDELAEVAGGGGPGIESFLEKVRAVVDAAVNHDFSGLALFFAK